MLLHLIADYGFGDLAFAEVRQRLVHHLPEADVVHLPVPSFDSLGAGFCMGQLARGSGPANRVLYSNVAPRHDDEDPRHSNEGERLVAGWLPNGVLVVGVNSTYAFSFVASSGVELHEVRLPPSGSQFRSRDVFPQLVADLVHGRWDCLGERLGPDAVPPVPNARVAYVDGYGNVKTTWTSPPAPSGTPVDVRVGEATLRAVVSDGTFAVPAGETSFAPGSSGWGDGNEQVRFYEIFTRGGSAADALGRPAGGSRVQVTPA